MTSETSEMKRTYISMMALATVLLVACAGRGAPGAAPTTTPAPPAVSPTAPQAAAQAGKLVAVDGGNYMDVTPAELKTMLDRKDFTFVNVHIPFEGDIANTDASIAYNEIDQNLDKLPAKDAKVVLYCRSGRMSTEAAQTLVKLGYTDVWNLDGGMIAWQQAGYALESK